mmetsp:Transcript_19356/g.55722  ORF Transcript_19356/g.55722 Transcript_19356/m.55722 type:complete len:218 (+) Transcript_19356:1152-1805(+)
MELGIDDTSEEGVLVATNDLLVPAENVLELIDLLGRKHGEDFRLGAVHFRDFGFGLDLLGLGPVLIVLGILLSNELSVALDYCNRVGSTLRESLTGLGADLLPATLLLEESNDLGRLLFVVQDALIVFKDGLDEALASLAFRLELTRKGEALNMVPLGNVVVSWTRSRGTDAELALVNLLAAGLGLAARAAALGVFNGVACRHFFALWELASELVRL